MMSAPEFIKMLQITPEQERVNKLYGCIDFHQVEEFKNYFNQNNIDPNFTYHGMPLLAKAANSGHDKTEIVEFLIQKGANVNAQDNDGWTALHMAVSRWSPSVVKFLLDQKADYNIENAFGYTPKTLASFQSYRSETKRRMLQMINEHDQNTKGGNIKPASYSTFSK